MASQSAIVFEQRPAESLQEPAVLSVSELSLLLKRLVEGNFQRVRIRGEISGFKLHSSGHSYFALKDQDAVMDAVCWRGTALPIKLEDGLEIIAQGRITTYPGRSKYQMVIESAQAAGQGALLKLLLERKSRLEAEGLFGRKRALPPFPQRIGIVTSPTGAVIKDILHRLEDRYPCSVLIWPVLVQGPGSAEQVTAAIEGFNLLPLDQRPDLLIVARGGGSLEDLWTFNEENVVRATAQSHIPIISAIGHETDTTLIDFAADLRAPTPTAAAELATPVLSTLKETVKDYQERTTRWIKRHLTNTFLHVTGLARGLPAPQRLLEGAMQRCDDWHERFTNAQISFLKNKQARLETAALRLPSPKFSLEKAEQTLGLISQRLQTSQMRLFEKLTETLKWHAMCLEQNSYQRVLEKGFCWVDNQDGLIRSAESLRAHAENPMTLHFIDGQVRILPQLIEE